MKLCFVGLSVYFLQSLRVAGPIEHGSARESNIRSLRQETHLIEPGSLVRFSTKPATSLSPD
jgi:hypothetical protein